MAQSRSLTLVRDVESLRAHCRAWRASGLTIGLIPTMGALHEGHLSLVRQIKQRCDVALASIFVNPTQFAAHEDLSKYPRDEAGDRVKLADAGCDLAFAPSADEMYPPGSATRVIVGAVSNPLEGVFRPHHFEGVATVVTKLLIQALPDCAIFGEKDYQQLLVIKRLARDLHMPVEIVAGAIVRNHDGLALSSRNAYLSEKQSLIAARLNQVLQDCVRELTAGAAIADVEAAASARLRQVGFDRVDYVAVRGADDLCVLETLDRPARILAAVWLGATRLIDNFPI